MSGYPSKLVKEPLVQAAFEMRFVSSADASVLLPGLFYAHLGVTASPERLGLDMPVEVLKQIDSGFEFQPRIRLIWQGFAILVAPASVALICPRPYPGWASFKAAILKVAEVISSQKSQVSAIRRISMRYIDLLALGNPASDMKMLKVAIEVAGHEPFDRPFSLRVERNEQDTIHVINVAAPANVEFPSEAPKTGVIVDIDSIQTSERFATSEWYGPMASSLDDLHLKNKRIFFDCLTDSGLKSLEPVYGV